ERSPYRILEDLSLPSQPTTTRRVRVGPKLFGSLLLSAMLGCGHERNGCVQGLSQRILPPPNTDSHEELFSPKVGAQAVAGGGPARLGQPEPLDEADSGQAKLPAQSRGGRADCEPGQTLTLPDAVALAFRLQPRLRASLESIRQAQGREDIAFAAFLPTVSSTYLAGGYHVQAGGTGFPIPGVPTSPNFTVLPLLGSVPVGLAGDTGFEVAELKLQWLVCDFGRRLGRYNQAGLAVDIAQLQTQRAYQTVADDVAVA